MARFLKHTACPKCGSSDANAVYSDGGTFCFSCRKPKDATLSPFVTAAQQQNAEESELASVSYPPDATQHYPPWALEWPKKYEITVEQLLKNKVYYSATRNQLIFGFEDEQGKVLAWQARNLSAESKARRYFTKGDVNSLLPIYHGPASHTRKLVLVEDCLSAIKVAALGLDSTSEKLLGIDSMPLLGSGISLKKLTRLRPFYDVLAVFLDPDMWHKSLVIAQQASMLGFNTRSIKGEKDPKEYSYLDLKGILNDI